MGAVTTDAHRAAAAKVRGWLAALDAARDLVAMGAYAPGRDRVLDEAMGKREAVEAFLRQGAAGDGYEATVAALAKLAG